MRVGCEVLGAPGKQYDAFGAWGAVVPFHILCSMCSIALLQDSLPAYRRTCFLNVRFKAGPMLECCDDAQVTCVDRTYAL